MDPTALVEVINATQAEREAAHAALASTDRPQLPGRADLCAMIDAFGDIEETLADPDFRLAALAGQLRGGVDELAGTD